MRMPKAIIQVTGENTIRELQLRLEDLEDENKELKYEIKRLRAAAAGANAGAEMVLVPRVATEHQYAAMRVFAEAMLESVGKLDVGLLYACGVQAAPVAGAGVRADETSDEKSADTPVT